MIKDKQDSLLNEKTNLSKELTIIETTNTNTNNNLEMFQGDFEKTSNLLKEQLKQLKKVRSH